MRGVCFHFLELLTVLHNLCLDCRNRPHFRDKFSAKKNVYIREHTNYSISGYYVYRDVKDAIPHNSFFGIPKFIGSLAPRRLGVLRKDAAPYGCPIIFFDIRAGLEPAHPWFLCPFGHFDYKNESQFSTLLDQYYRFNGISGILFLITD